MARALTLGKGSVNVAKLASWAGGVVVLNALSTAVSG